MNNPRLHHTIGCSVAALLAELVGFELDAG
jgi:hypothetical protein